MRIAMPTMRICNAILWVFVGTGTINRTLRLRSGRGDTWIIINKNNEMGNANIWQRTFRNIHLLRKCMAANTPQGVGADSSRPFFNRTKWFWCGEMMRIATPFGGITWVRYEVLQCQRWKIATPFYGCSWVRYDVLQYQRWEYATPFCGCSWTRAR